MGGYSVGKTLEFLATRHRSLDTLMLKEIGGQIAQQRHALMRLARKLPIIAAVSHLPRLCSNVSGLVRLSETAELASQVSQVLCRFTMAQVMERIKGINLTPIVNKASSIAKKTGSTLNKCYQVTATTLQGPVRNGVLVGRELTKIVIKERQMTLPRAEWWEPAKAEYRQWLETVLPKRLREQGEYGQAIKQWMDRLVWKDVGMISLVIGECMALYYLSKMGGKMAGKAATMTSKSEH